VYYPYAQYPARQQTIVIRTNRDDPHSVFPALRAAVRELDPKLALYQVQSFDEAVASSLWHERLQGNVLSIFAVLALLLACTGLYGVIAYAVAERSRELGVRIALGATRRDVLWLVFSQSARLVAVGTAIGLGVALVSVRILDTLLYGVQPTDPATFTIVPVLLGAVALIAALVPARRATRVDPIISMRAE
jgi:putative ABC transport system permease protein